MSTLSGLGALALDPHKYNTSIAGYITTSLVIQHASWRTMIIDYPIQTDGCNYGVFVMLFIEHYITKGKSGFETNNMYDHRLKIAEKLKQFICNL